MLNSNINILSTDQDDVELNNIKLINYSVNGLNIINIIKTFCLDLYLICFEKDSLDENVPDKKTIVKSSHKIMFNNKIQDANLYTKQSKNIYKIKYNGEILNEILLEKYNFVKINNLYCESLCYNENIDILNLNLEKINLFIDNFINKN